ncbi:MAG: hypothetical protein ACYTFG_20190, partial [Planctomycetota bacterium]
MNKRMRRYVDSILIITFLIAFIFLARSCRAADEKIPQMLIDSLVQRREAIKRWALTCGPGPF